MSERAEKVKKDFDKLISTICLEIENLEEKKRDAEDKWIDTNKRLFRLAKFGGLWLVAHISEILLSFLVKNSVRLELIKTLDKVQTYTLLWTVGYELIIVAIIIHNSYSYKNKLDLINTLIELKNNELTNRKNRKTNYTEVLEIIDEDKDKNPQPSNWIS